MDLFFDLTLSKLNSSKYIVYLYVFVLKDLFSNKFQLRLKRLKNKIKNVSKVLYNFHVIH